MILASPVVVSRDYLYVRGIYASWFSVVGVIQVNLFYPGHIREMMVDSLARYRPGYPLRMV